MESVTTVRGSSGSAALRALCRWIVASSLLLFCAGESPAHDTTCPDTKSTNVDAKTEKSGEKRCGLGLSFLNDGVGIFGTKCPKTKYLYPAHPECLGAANEGTRCTAGEKAEVKMQNCECAVLGFLGSGVRLPGCDCRDAGSGGFIETGKTVDCVEA